MSLIKSLLEDTLNCILKWAIRALGGSQARLVRASSATLPQDRLVDEERVPSYASTRFYPVTLGDVYKKRYEVLAKLGFGISSTVWLAQDLLRWKRYVTLKVLTNDVLSRSGRFMELEVSKRIRKEGHRHWASAYVRCVTDSFEIPGPDGKHMCLVYKPLREDLFTFQRSIQGGFMYVEKSKSIIRHVLAELDFLHRHCHVIHTDIKARNILFEFGESGEIEEYLKEDAEEPLPHKVAIDRFLYLSRPFGIPKLLGRPVLADFGHASLGDEENMRPIQPDAYRAPEVIMEATWSYSADIWNMGCFIWEIFEGRSLFNPMYTIHTDSQKEYSDFHHLAEIQTRIGPPPEEFYERHPLTKEMYNEGVWLGGLLLNDDSTLEDSEQRLKRDDKRSFLEFVRSMLQWLPEKRKTAYELLEDPWLNSPSEEGV